MATDLNDKTSLPHRVSLGDVLTAIEMSPGEIAAFLTDLSNRFRDSAHPNLARNFADHAALVTNPQTYGYSAPDTAPAAQERPYEPPSPSSVGYGRNASDALDKPQSSQSAQGQATTPGTLATPLLTPSQEQQATNQAGSAPAPSPSPALPENDNAAPTDVGEPATTAPADQTSGFTTPTTPTTPSDSPAV